MANKRDFLEQSKWFFILVIGLLLYLSFMIVRPVVNALVLGAVGAYLFYPVYKKIHYKTEMANLSAFLCCFLCILLIIVPIFMLTNTLTSETGQIYGKLKEIILDEDYFLLGCPDESTGIVCKTLGAVNNFLENPEVKATLGSILRELMKKINDSVQNFVLSLPRVTLFWFVAVFSMFYLVRDGVDIINSCKEAMPIEKQHQEKIFSQLHNTLFGVVYGTLAVAVIQGVLAMFGFYIAGLSNPVFWSVVLALFACIPFFGAWIIWLPAGISLIIGGNTVSSNSVVLKGFGLMLYGFMVISAIDNVLKPYLVGQTAKMPTLLIVLGIVGGLFALGPLGFVIGPIALSLLKTFFDIYRKEKVFHGGV